VQAATCQVVRQRQSGQLERLGVGVELALGAHEMQGQWTVLWVSHEPRLNEGGPQQRQ
jgi:hypothetical protein